jgi:hypothetical protein
MPDQRPDAIRSPLGFAGAGDAFAKLSKLHTEFAPILQVSRIYVRHQGSEHFISGDPSDTLYFPSQGLRSGEPRYDWADRGDGVLYGQLRANA